MESKTKAWSTGTGSVTAEYDGQGDGQITITSDANNLYEARSMQIVVKTTDGSNIERTLTIQQAAKQRIDLSAAIVTAANQTYSGGAKTPAPTVTLNGNTIPSSGYNVTYSNNTNAGTATVTVTGKGDYTGTATGTFTIAKASRSLSFNGSYMVLNTSSNGTKTATPSAGSGDGAITYSIANTTYATINSSSGNVTSKTSDGSVTVTATIAEGSNYLGATATYTLYVFATTHNYSYSGSAKNVTLPPGTYKFQCWGAQGGGNNAGYGSGGKGGYSEGVLTISGATIVQINVGGMGGTSSAGWNGGGSSTGYSSYNSGDTNGYSYMGGGGGATDIRLSDGALLSRMIVAGGGSGAAYIKRIITTETQVLVRNLKHTIQSSGATYWYGFEKGKEYIFVNNAGVKTAMYVYDYNRTLIEQIASAWDSGEITYSFPSNAWYLMCYSGNSYDISVYADEYETHTETDEYYDYIHGFVGGGTTGNGYNSSYGGSQNSAGTGGSFGQGANQTTTNYRYCSAAGGGGWYGGGGGQRSDSDTSTFGYSGGGSGFVNTYANRNYRPSGYTGLQLDSGSTYPGNVSFESTSGGNETGHSGNGYARITRLS